MKKTSIYLLISLWVIFSCILLLSFTHGQLKKQKQIVYGPSVKTEELDGVHCGSVIDQDHECFDGLLFHKYIMTVSAPSGYELTGQPYLHCVINNGSSCEWNGGYWNRAVTLESSTDFKKMLVYVSSGSITVNLACEATEK